MSLVFVKKIYEKRTNEKRKREKEGCYAIEFDYMFL